MKAAQRWLIVAGCSYEVVSITGGKSPTLTAICRRWPALRLLLIGALGVHLYRTEGRTRP